MHGIFTENVPQHHHHRRQMIPWPLPSVSSVIKCFHGFHSTHPPISSIIAAPVEMVKFSKQFEAQLVPEWKEAFVDYWQLKKDVKRMQASRENTTAPPPSLALALLSSWTKLPPFDSIPRKEHGTIQIHRKLMNSASRGVMYETELLEQFADSDAAREFFVRLDLQLNKVNQFYKGKEKEFVERGESLKKQMEILLELKAALKNQKGQVSVGDDPKDDPSISCSIFCEEDAMKEEQEQAQEILATEYESGDFQFVDPPQGSDELEKPKTTDRLDEVKLRSLSGRAFTLQGKNLLIKIPLTTPSRTISALAYLFREDLGSQLRKCGSQSGKLNINKAKIHRAEKMIRGAFVELHKGLGYLKTYRTLNMLAFAKILKKFDKVTGKQVLNTYLKVVEVSYFNSSDMAMKLMDEVEELFIKHFADDNKQKAMKYLKTHQHKESHGVTFFIGLFTGCFIAMFIGYCIMAHMAGMYTGQSDTTIYMETVYPILSMFSLLFLHLFLYGCNIFMWRKTRINYAFIFEFAHTKELKYREVFLICTTAMTAVVGVMFAHLVLIARGHSSTHVQAIPGFLFLMFMALLICPFDIVYRSSRYHFLRVIRNIMLSPLYKVVMVDFFMADQLCSQVPMLRNMEFVTCYYITGSYRTQDYGYCMRSKHFKDLSYAVSFLPYYWRAMQCARRWFDEGETSHLVNLGKYVSAMLAAGAKVAYEKENNIGWLLLVVVVSSAATVYQLYWDFVKDWGLLQLDSKNPWLRSELILRRKYVYYISMGLNLVMRLAWLQTVLHYNFGNVDYRVTSFFLAALEVIRRGQWNFYRLENEHLNNAGKFRAVKTVPLPFHEVDQD
ncbi:phosphate transporter PHO1 homolog 1-like [Zingiber officinale]|uniref:phosphate transporter PHO1 homolog 1-like n=1 Tax=Zingiber officinale TaxID=94328 RepID=UPI001C4C3ACB|nr:phosphate transporter PHO1 homolog 1-like [Zingiber officinale]